MISHLSVAKPGINQLQEYYLIKKLTWLFLINNI